MSRNKRIDPLGDPEKFPNLFQDLQREDRHRSDFDALNDRKQIVKFFKEFTRGLDQPEIYLQLRKNATARKRVYIEFDDIYEFLDIPFVFRLHRDKKAKSGISDRVGAYLDRLPKKLLEGYEEWVTFARTAYPTRIAILVFKLPFLSGQMAVMHEGNTGIDIPGTGRIVYNTEETDYVIRSAYAFGIATQSLG